MFFCKTKRRISEPSIADTNQGLYQLLVKAATLLLFPFLGKTLKHFADKEWLSHGQLSTYQRRSSQCMGIVDTLCYTQVLFTWSTLSIRRSHLTDSWSWETILLFAAFFRLFVLVLAYLFCIKDTTYYKRSFH